jgi:hypothetical protein
MAKIKLNIMRKFFSENWYRLMIGLSLLMASFGLMIHSISTLKAENPKNNNYTLSKDEPGVEHIGLGILNGYAYLMKYEQFSVDFDDDVEVKGYKLIKVPIDKFSEVRLSNDFPFSGMLKNDRLFIFSGYK